VIGSKSVNIAIDGDSDTVLAIVFLPPVDISHVKNFNTIKICCYLKSLIIITQFYYYITCELFYFESRYNEFHVNFAMLIDFA